MADLLLKNANILDVVEGRLVGEHDVLVSGGRIVEIDRTITYPSADRLDLAGRTLMPGLCDAHVHAAAPMNSFAELEWLPPSYVAVRSAAVLEGMLQRGFTTVRDGGGADFGLARAIEEGFIKGPRLLYCGKALSQTGGHGDMRQPGRTLADQHPYVPGLGQICDGVDAVRRAARDEIRRGAHHIKLMVGGGIASPSDPIDQDQYSEDEIRAAVEEAASANRYVMVHSYTNRSVARAVRCGARSIEHANFLDDETAQLILAHDARVVPTLAIFHTMATEGLEMGISPRVHGLNKEMLAHGMRALEVARRNAVPLAYGTDLSGKLHRHQSIEFSLRAEVFSPAELVRQATVAAAELFQMGERIGRVAVGLEADLIAIDGNPLERIDLLQDQGRHIDLILKGGAVIKAALG
ncbi:metal-dependent hydrolase family protein [Acuticoccus mangrovi]|uniref:Amidohydrolase family protein n=1 Tax=Acuticoccus mangrovi TaxID=2796142 RepID=A0A934IR34_9HYPH|nr:amidohydrolase family protein [Acuticoccus mangrovi]MBJ3776722.1 amidohydrolase family protein [Acuticoccus mangrovi]